MEHIKRFFDINTKRAAVVICVLALVYCLLYFTADKSLFPGFPHVCALAAGALINLAYTFKQEDLRHHRRFETFEILHLLLLLAGLAWLVWILGWVLYDFSLLFN